MKTTRYNVRCNNSIAEEMVRYESGKIIAKTDPQCDEKWVGDKELEDAYITFNFIIESPFKNIRRWASFGIKV